MFESLVLTGQNVENKKPIDMGSLVEAMFLYGRVTVIANYGILDQIYYFFGGENLLWILDEGYLVIVYQEHPAGIHTQLLLGTEFHNPIQFSSPQHVFQDELRKICIDAKGRKDAGRRLAQRIEKYIQVSRETPRILDGTSKSIVNPNYLHTSTQIIINELVPSFGWQDEFKFLAIPTENGLVIETNLDFELINKIYHKSVSPSHSKITPGYILSHLLNLEESLFFAATYSSELSCNSLSTRLGINKVDYIIEHSLQRNKRLSSFKEVVFKNVNAIKEAVNSGSVDVDSILKVLQKSRKYKEWLLTMPPNADLLQEYLIKVGEKSFMEKLPGKILRCALFSGCGLAASSCLPPMESIGVGLSLNVLDTFFFDKICGGWKPNHYIDNQLKPLINQ